jgi:hypothetical protein
MKEKLAGVAEELLGLSWKMKMAVLSDQIKTESPIFMF